jgi:hypothetical protein
MSSIPQPVMNRQDGMPQQRQQSAVLIRICHYA